MLKAVLWVPYSFSWKPPSPPCCYQKQCGKELLCRVTLYMYVTVSLGITAQSGVTQLQRCTSHTFLGLVSSRLYRISFPPVESQFQLLCVHANTWNYWSLIFANSIGLKCWLLVFVNIYLNIEYIFIGYSSFPLCLSMSFACLFSLVVFF